MQDRFKFKAIVKGYYYIDTPEKCEEFEPLIFLENIDVLDIGDIGISEEDLEIAIRKQYPDLQDVYIERIMENFRDNSNGIDTYITITPERVYQCTGLKDKNGKLIYEGDIISFDCTYRNKITNYKFAIVFFNGCFGVFTETNFEPLTQFLDYHCENEKTVYDDCYAEVIGNRYENCLFLRR